MKEYPPPLKLDYCSREPPPNAKSCVNYWIRLWFLLFRKYLPVEDKTNFLQHLFLFVGLPSFSRPVSTGLRILVSPDNDDIRLSKYLFKGLTLFTAYLTGSLAGGREKIPFPKPKKCCIKNFNLWYCCCKNCCCIKSSCYFPEMYNTIMAMEDRRGNLLQPNFPLRFLYVNFQIYSKIFKS